MKFKTILLGTAALAVMAAPAFAQDATKTDAPKKHHRHMEHMAAASSIDARIDELERQIQDLKATQAQAQAAPPPAPSEAVSQAQFEALQNQVYEQQASTQTLTKSSWWANTTLGGRVYFDLSDVENKNAGVKNPQSGFHFDIKRFYLIIDHKFNDVWSADLTTDATFDTSQCNSPVTTTITAGPPATAASTCASTGATTSSLYIKKAYVQGKFDDLAVLRLGSADMPWIPFMENVYGYRFVENTLVDRVKYGNSADWGAFLSGSTGSDLQFEYSLAAVNGAGYKKPAFGIGTNRSRGMDFEGRMDIKYDGFILGVGGYDGKLGKDLGTGTTQHDATRFDAVAAYVLNGFHVGVEYFSEKNFDTVTSTKTDSGDGYSGFASYQFDPSWALFGRYDWVKPKKDAAFSPKLTNDYYNVGIDYTAIKGVDLSLVYKHDTAKNGSITDSNGMIGPQAGAYSEIGLFGQFTF